MGLKEIDAEDLFENLVKIKSDQNGIERNQTTQFPMTLSRR